ncbi:hypothetical protein C2845_PM03G35830 [Panicum miliaceum]|uniref:ethanolamine-phosphate cytidylyltransferase n=1 Tax=Panicum miliaceum TaxID=4540 RepID=A0A3L6T8J5_PANMI|nr:hypothetical protein C2845_PM03G35830 [Panicum miliaceum]
MHYGHCNALRQACALGDELIVSFISDDEIKANKGPPVTALHEREYQVSCSVIPLYSIIRLRYFFFEYGPYAITGKNMNKLFDEYNIDYIIHGDDPFLLPDGTDVCALAKKAGRYKQIKRIEGVSMTDIVDFDVRLCFAKNDFLRANCGGVPQSFAKNDIEKRNEKEASEKYHDSKSFVNWDMNASLINCAAAELLMRPLHCVRISWQSFSLETVVLLDWMNMDCLLSATATVADGTPGKLDEPKAPFGRPPAPAPKPAPPGALPNEVLHAQLQV